MHFGLIDRTNLKSRTDMNYKKLTFRKLHFSYLFSGSLISILKGIIINSTLISKYVSATNWF